MASETPADPRVPSLLSLRSQASRPVGHGMPPPATGLRGDQLEGLLTVDEVATMLRLKPSTIRAYAERCTLPCVRVGNRLRFKPSDLDLWIARRYQGERRTA